jgi:integrase/recombinase XerD
MTHIRSTPELDAAIAAFVGHQRTLGRRYYGEEGVLRDLRRFVVGQQATDLTAVVFERWCRAQHALSPNTLYSRQLLVRKLCVFRRRHEPGCFVPDPAGFARRRPYRRAVIVAPVQIDRMLRAAVHRGSVLHSPMRSAVMRMALVLLYSAGLRRGEVMRLTLPDVDHRAGILRIRESKFHKSRWVPLSADACRELRRYLRVRRRYGVPFDAPLLCNRSHGYGYTGWHAYSGQSLVAGIGELFTRAHVLDTEGRRPRLHDLRHSFAVEALRRHYRSGGDVQTFLPKLALYMGHVSIVSTAHYLQFMPDIARYAGERFRRHFAHVITPQSP